MRNSPKSKQDKTVFFFNSSINFMKKTGQLRGSKLKSTDQNKLLTLRTRFIQRSQLMKVRQSLNQKQYSKQMLEHPLTQRHKFSNQNLHLRSLYRKFKPQRKFRNQQDDIMITSQSNSLPKQIRARDLPRFQSTNLEGKMNEYLNLIIRKSHQSHHQKLKKMQSQQKQQRSYRAQNMFYRRMKISQNRKKFQKQKQQSSFDSYTKQFRTGEIMSNLNRLKKRSKNQIQQSK